MPTKKTVKKTTKKRVSRIKKERVIKAPASLLANKVEEGKFQNNTENITQVITEPFSGIDLTPYEQSIEKPRLIPENLFPDKE